MLKFKFGKDIKHNAFWKFNCSLFRDKEYLDQVNTEIENVSEEYTAGHFGRSILHNITKSEIELSIPDPNKLFLGFMLKKIRSKTITYTSMKKRKRKKKSITLKKALNKKNF